MIEKVKANVEASYNALLKGEGASLDEIEETEEYIDYLNTEISRYIVRLMSVEMSEADTRRINNYYLALSNIERIGDHAMNIAEYTRNMKKWDISFSDDARTEIKKMKQVSMNILDVIDFTDATTPAAQLEIISKYEFLMDDMEKNTGSVRSNVPRKETARPSPVFCSPSFSPISNGSATTP